MISRSFSGSPSLKNCRANASLMITTGGAPLVVALRERSPALHRNLEHIEVARATPSASRRRRGTARRSSGRPWMTNGESIAAFERHAARGARHLDAWHRAQPLDAVANQPLDGVRREEPRTLQRHPHRQHVGGVEPGSTAPSATDVRISSAGSDEQDQRQRDFHDDEDRARLVLPEAGARSSGALLERGAEIGARALESPGIRPNRTPVTSDTSSVNAATRQSTADQRAVLADARQVRGVDRQQRANAGDAEHEARARRRPATAPRSRSATGA